MKNTPRQWTHLVNEVLRVVVRERLGGANDLVQVRVHELVHQVHVLEVGTRRRRHDVLHRDDVLVAQVAQQLDLSRCVHSVLVSVAKSPPVWLGTAALENPLAFPSLTSLSPSLGWQLPA